MSQIDDAGVHFNITDIQHFTKISMVAAKEKSKNKLVFAGNTNAYFEVFKLL